MQLNIFSTDILCSLCRGDPGFKNNNPELWNGFYDLDTGDRVCIHCKTKHYQQKNSGPKKNLYSELPIVIATEKLKQSINE